jgi:hypothetical protein
MTLPEKYSATFGVLKKYSLAANAAKGLVRQPLFLHNPYFLDAHQKIIFALRKLFPGVYSK